MNSIILNDNSGVITDQRTIDHIHQTLKLALGDIVKITILNTGTGTGIVKSLNFTSCQIDILEIHPQINPWFDLIIGASRPQTTKKIIEHATTFGANSFNFYKATLSEKSYLDSKIFEMDSVNELINLGLSQSAIYSKVPDFNLYKYNPADKFQHYEEKYILDINGKHSFLDEKIDFSKPIAISVGPERGFASEDLANFTNAGFKSIKISKTILRVEHAVYATIAQLEMLRRNF
jgi:RsmE family RNA methyltransferase